MRRAGIVPELLSPAGTPEAAWAALAYGADAVYAGLPQFSARADAGNFSAGELDELIGYAHHLGRRVLITLNTLLQERDVKDALEALAVISDLHADGVIVQDMGVVRLVRRHFPQLPLHASTQMAVHNLEGAQQLADLGFTRVVLARELDLEAVAHITKHCGIETEVFIHGALCYSYSGLCLFSSHLMGRSGNRGRCAYCCRQPFESGGQRSLPFSMKDFAAVEYVPALQTAGVRAFKIEGRMKSPAYVAAVTKFYRDLLAGDVENTGQRLADIQTIFGRPATSLYLGGANTDVVEPVNAGHHGALMGRVEGVKNGWLIVHSNRALQKHDGLRIEMAGDTTAYGFAALDMRLASDPVHKRYFELPAEVAMAIKLPPDAPRLERGAAVYCSYDQAIRQQYRFTVPRAGQYRQRRMVHIHVEQSTDQLVLTASAGAIRHRLTWPGPFEVATHPEKAQASFTKSLSKLGDTAWTLDQLTFEGPILFVPASILNEARRQLIEGLTKAWGPPSVPVLEALPEVGAAPDTLCWSVKARSFYDLAQVDEFVLEVDPNHPEEIERALSVRPDSLRLALPVIMRDQEVAAYRQLVKRFSHVSKWEAANLGGLNLLREQADITADWPLYALNAQAVLQWQAQGVRQCVLSPEDDAENMFALIKRLGPAVIVPVFQHTPLMISATRPEAETDELIDRSQRTFRIESNGREYVLIQTTPFSLVAQLDDLKAFGARDFRIDLCYGLAAPDDAIDLVRSILSGREIPGDSYNFSRGLR